MITLAFISIFVTTWPILSRPSNDNSWKRGLLFKMLHLFNLLFSTFKCYFEQHCFLIHYFSQIVLSGVSFMQQNNNIVYYICDNTTLQALPLSEYIRAQTLNSTVQKTQLVVFENCINCMNERLPSEKLVW